MKKIDRNVIYLDNNSTTFTCEPAKKIHCQWLSCYNPSSDSKTSKSAKQLIDKSSHAILHHCGVSAATHTVIFTSGATESNCFIIRACVKAYKKKLTEKGSRLKPHIISSAIEHYSIIDCLKDLVDSGEIEVSHIYPTIYGTILAEDVEKEIKPNTCLVTVMYANNEIPVINNITEISKVAHKHHVPLHSDCVQIFGKYKVNVNVDGIDALSASGHKFYAPKGIGLLIINNQLIEGYKLTAEINGSQQGGLRGGTENVPGIGSMMTALQYTFRDRQKKNKKLSTLRKHLLDKLALVYPFVSYEEYVYPDEKNTNTTTDTESSDEKKSEKPAPIKFVSLGPPEDAQAFILPNTVLLAICKDKGRPFCNVELKHFLDSKNIVVSIGSACLTKHDKASHVLTAIGAPPVIKRGVIRISLGDNTTLQEINAFVNILKQGIQRQLNDETIL